MSNTTKLVCPQCGDPFVANSPAGLCPRCLMAMNLATQTELTGPNANSPGGPRTAPPKPVDIAPHFPNFDILECLGRGGMGVVYKARQKSLNRLVALKILAPEREKDAAFAQRFTVEAETLAKLNHPGIVTIYDFGQTNGLFYLVMEFVDGVTLRRLLEAARMSPREALAIVPQICDALQYAHDQGIVHRDIKPENILLDRRGRLKVADFGLAKLVEAANGAAPEADLATAAPLHTEAGKVMGTPTYMAPEQAAQPTSVDHRADIYALGVVFYQMLTGELPGKPLQPPSRKVQIDVRLDEVVLHALEQEPQRRYQQASEVKSALETIAATPASRASEPVVEPAAPKLAESGALGKRGWVFVFVAGIVTVLFLECAVLALQGTGFAQLWLGLAAGGVALISLLLARTPWFKVFLAGLAMSILLWLGMALIIANGQIAAGLAVEAVAIALFLFVARKSQLPRGFLGAFMTAFLVVFGGTVGVTLITPELYRSTARVMLAPHPAQSSAAAKPSGVSVSYDPYLIQTELGVIQSSIVLDPVIQSLDLGGVWSKRFGRGQPLTSSEVLSVLKSQIDLRPARNANLIEIRINDQQPELASKIANEIALAYRTHHISVEAAGSGANSFRVVLVDRAVPGLRASSPNKPLNVALGALGGLVLGTAAGAARVRSQGRRKA
jgi:capsular polysaccharide biosynthesis protein/tRNA A-37 threonylcarbamoyl transferase component Bud32